MYSVKGVKPLNQKDFPGQYLVLINPEKIPHLIVVQGNKYFSLTNSESIVNENFKPYFSKLKRAKRKLLLFELKPSKIDLAAVFEQYKSVNTESITCLVPVKESLLKNSNAKFVFELIPELYEANLINSALQLNLEDELTSLGEFNLNTYSLEDIFNYIKHLNSKHD